MEAPGVSQILSRIRGDNENEQILDQNDEEERPRVVLRYIEPVVEEPQ